MNNKHNENSLDRVLRGEITVSCAIEEAFDTWTTEEGLRSFFSSSSSIDLYPGGKFEILFDLEAPIGRQGSEGQIVMAVQRPVLFAFSWNSPPHLDQVREHRTHVVVRFYSLGPKQTRVTLTQDGWGSGGQWDASYDYFDRAWFQLVLPNFQKLFNN